MGVAWARARVRVARMLPFKKFVRHDTRYSSAAILLLSWIFGCDPSAVVETKTHASGDRAAQAACFDDCDGKGLSATDRSTCRLNCEEAHKVAPSAGPPALAAVANCMGSCDAAAKSCVDACRDPAVAPAVLDALAGCVGACQADARSSVDDRATCRLVCAQDVAPKQ